MWYANMVLTKRKLVKAECLKIRLKTKILVSGIGRRVDWQFPTFRGLATCPLTSAGLRPWRRRRRNLEDLNLLNTGFKKIKSLNPKGSIFRCLTDRFVNGCSYPHFFFLILATFPAVCIYRLQVCSLASWELIKMPRPFLFVRMK